MAAIKVDPKVESQVRDLVARFRYDAYGFVMAVFPWGVPGTSLARWPNGPEAWQKDLLIAVSRHRIENAMRKKIGLDYKVWRSAVASGHGVGKSALVAWIIYWLMSTSMDTRGVVTANTANQLQTKTWPELGKWHNMAINKHWFEWTGSSLYYARYPEDKQKNYKVDALTVSPENTEAWAGLHNETGVVFVIFDEASGIHHLLWQTAEGAFTDGEPFFFTFGNPTQPDGDFADCFLNDPRERWWKRNVDSRSVSHTNKAHLKDIIEQNGLDSDFTRIRVLGTFPTKAYDGFIAPSDVTAAQQREVFTDTGVGLILAVDVARFGDDENVACFRQGTDARSIPWRTWRGTDTVGGARKIQELITEYKPDAVVIESTGPGQGVIDTLRSWNYKVIEVYPGAPSSRKEYLNVRTELWSKGKDWIVTKGCLPEADGVLFKQLTGIRYMATGKAETILTLEKKVDMKKRGLDSPDRADALMLSFAHTVARRDLRTSGSSRSYENRRARIDYDELGMTG